MLKKKMQTYFRKRGINGVMMAAAANVAPPLIYNSWYKHKIAEKYIPLLEEKLGIPIPQEFIKFDKKTTKPYLLPLKDKFGTWVSLSKKIGINAAHLSRLLYKDAPIPFKYVMKIVKLSDNEIKPEDLNPDFKDL